MQVTRKMRIANEGQRTGIQHSRRPACYLLMAPGAFHPDGLSGPSPAANQTSAEASVIDLPHAKGRASASLWRCAMPQMVARIFQPDAKLCYAMRLTIKSAHQLDKALRSAILVGRCADLMVANDTI